MAIETTKNLGGVGAILLFIGVIPWTWPYGGWLLALVGLILAMISFKGLADYYKEAGVFNNALYAVILGIVGLAVFLGIVIIAAFGLLTELGLDASNIADWSSRLSQLDLQAMSGTILSFFAQILLAGVVLWVCSIIAAVLLRKSLGVVSTKSGVGLFGTTGLLMLIGAVIPILGLLLIWIGLILLAVAFFSIRPQQEQPAMVAGAPS